MLEISCIRFMNSFTRPGLFEWWTMSKVLLIEPSILVRGAGQVIDVLGIFAVMILVSVDGFCIALSISPLIPFDKLYLVSGKMNWHVVPISLV